MHNQAGFLRTRRVVAVLLVVTVVATSAITLTLTVARKPVLGTITAPHPEATEPDRHLVPGHGTIAP
jgi:hypothetical protein